MADENIKETKEGGNASDDADQLFNKQSEFSPLRDTELEDEDLSEDEHGVLEDRMEGGRKPTDYQVLAKILNPDFGYKHLNLVATGRTFPDVYNYLFSILVKDLIKKSLAEGASLSVAEAMATVNTALSKSIDGEGILDNIAAYTKGHVSEVEEKNKNIGLS